MARSLAAAGVGRIVDSLGGVNIVLPPGRKTRVSFRSRRLAGSYEPAVTDRFLAQLRENSIVLDVGAHWGLYTLMAAPLVRSVIAFEPDPGNRAILETNIRLAGLGNVAVRAEALSDRTGTIEFHRYVGRSWGMSMMGGLLPSGFTVPVSVPTIAIDGLGATPDLIKIDVEGAEHAVLKGAERTLARSGPALIVEVHETRLGSLGSSPVLLREYLEGLGYRIEVISAVDHGEERVEHWIATRR